MDDLDQLFIQGDEDALKKTMYHGGFDLLRRLDKILNAINLTKVPKGIENNAETIVRYDMYLQLLSDLYAELYPFLDDKSKADAYKILKELRLNIRSNKMTLGKSPRHALIQTDTDDKFLKLELLLRTEQQEKGLLMPSKRGALDAAGLV